MNQPPDHRMSIQDFKESGALQEVNRRLLHPCGLAFIVNEHYADDDPENKGPILRWSFGGVMDYRDDHVGIACAPSDPPTLESYQRFEAMFQAKKLARMEELGFFIQPTAGPEEEPEIRDGMKIIPLVQRSVEDRAGYWQAQWTKTFNELVSAGAEIKRLQEEATTAPPEPEVAIGAAANDKQLIQDLRATLFRSEKKLAQRTKQLDKMERGEGGGAAYGEPDDDQRDRYQELRLSLRDVFLAGGVVGDEAAEKAREMCAQGRFDTVIERAIDRGKSARAAS